MVTGGSVSGLFVEEQVLFGESVSHCRVRLLWHHPPASSVLGILQARYWSGLPFPSPGDLPDPVGSSRGKDSDAATNMAGGQGSM